MASSSPQLWRNLTGFLTLGILCTLIAWIQISQLQHKTRIQSPGSRVVERGNLQLREGQWLEKDTPFTGIMVEHRPDGTLESRSTVSNGLLQGLSERWHTNGVLQVVEHFNAGVSDGTRTKFYINGRKLSEANVVRGQLDGLYERWHENGQLAEQVRLKRGVAHGESVAFHPDGSVKTRVRLAHGNVVD